VVGAGTLVLALVLLLDLLGQPTTTLRGLGVDASLDEDVVAATRTPLLLAALVFPLVLCLAWLERAPDSVSGLVWLRRRAVSYRAAGRELAQLWQGNLVFGFLVVEAALIGLGGMLVVGRWVGWATVDRLPDYFRSVAQNLWWVVPLVLAAVPITFELSRLVVARLMAWLRLPRVAAGSLGAAVAGALLCFGYYPAVAAQLSPKAMFESYQALHRPGEALGVVGVRARTARFYAHGEQVAELASARQAFEWLMGAAKGAAKGAAPPRRWLLLRDDDLPAMNALYRASAGAPDQARNLPVLDARAGRILLASNQLAGHLNHNPFERFIRSTPPASLAHPAVALFEDQLQSLGWDVADDQGQPARAVVPGRRYRMRFYYRVVKTPTRAWRAFLHIDGFKRRHNGDRDPLENRYPMQHWQPGDIVVDPYELELEPNFLPGDYQVYFGFFAGKQRMPVRRGKHRDNRVHGGSLTVR
jgi:hypothetical protein